MKYSLFYFKDISLTKAKDTRNIVWSDYFYYDETSPTYLRNKISKVGVRMDSFAGTQSKRSGYSFVKLHGVVYPIHRVIVEMTGRYLRQDEFVDHINGVRSDNSINNLRVVSSSGNRKNTAKSKRNKSGFCGIRYRSDKNAWVGFVNNLDGQDLQKSFSSTKYGYITAKIYAKMWRETEVSKLNLQGAGYSNRHGE